MICVVGLLILAAYAGAAGCGSAGGSVCETVCNASAPCGATAFGNCAAACAAEQKLADSAGCSAERAAVEDCWAAHDVCVAFEDDGPCGFGSGQPGHAYETCISRYCDQPDAPCGEP